MIEKPLKLVFYPYLYVSPGASMKIYYITLNTQDEAQKISYALLKEHLAVCTNWFPIMCAYRWQGAIKHEAEVVLVIKTKKGLRNDIEKIVSQYINYTNCIAEINVESINNGFLQWLNAEVPPHPTLGLSS
jgi:periplasmic divalent cation tolerance protein